jgi:two-component system sensor histidine kinase KdpD
MNSRAVALRSVNKGDSVHPGTGLGLAISRGFVEAMHGTVTANRTDPSGAVFTISLPITTEAKTLETSA